MDTPRRLSYHGFMPQDPAPHDEPPPFLGSWRRVYAGVLIYLAAIIFVFYLFTRAYR